MSKTLLFVTDYMLADLFNTENEMDLKKALENTEGYLEAINHPRVFIKNDNNGYLDTIYFYEEDVEKIKFIKEYCYDMSYDELKELFSPANKELYYKNMDLTEQAVDVYKEMLEEFYNNNSMPKDVFEWARSHIKCVVVKALELLIEEVKETDESHFNFS